MKITALETYLVPPRWLFLRIETDEGLVGWGEPVLEGHAETLAAKIGEYGDFLIGRDPLMIEDILQSLYRNGCYRGGPVLMSAISGIDMALWDIKGRHFGAPVHALLGGRVRDRIRSYCWIGGDRPRNLVAEALALRDRGYDAMKFNACDELRFVDSHAAVDTIVDRVGELRDAIGATMDFAVDFHGRVHRPMAKTLLRELEPFRPLFVEDPLASAHLDDIADLSRATSIPLALGERIHTRTAFRDLLEKRAAAIVNPDTAHVGGISEMLRIGAMAEAYDVALAPHCPLGPIALAACLQVDALCINAAFQEQSLGMHYNSNGDLLDYVRSPGLPIEDGHLLIPEGPGLGIEVDEDKVAAAAQEGHRWRAPVWRHTDGAIAEW